MNEPLTISWDDSQLTDYIDKFPCEVLDRAMQLTALQLNADIVKEAPVDHGRLSQSVDLPIQVGPLVWGIKIGAHYWRIIQYGRGVVFPVNAKVLVFEIDGETIFAMSSRAVKPNPFISRAIANTTERIPEFVTRAIKEFES